jgi:hypothetical protein
MMTIAILEDSLDRQAEMRRCLQERLGECDVFVSPTAKEMMAYLTNNLARVHVISLDHDLELIPQPDGKLLDGGTGREVADYLALQKPTCPVIVHTSNSVAGDGMEFVLRDARWDTHRVYPWGGLEWIASRWIGTLRTAIRKKGAKRKRGHEPDAGIADP